MEKLSVTTAVGKLAMAGEQAGFSLEQMIDLLNAGVGVEMLLELISWRLEGRRRPPVPFASSSGWLM